MGGGRRCRYGRRLHHFHSLFGSRRDDNLGLGRGVAGTSFTRGGRFLATVGRGGERGGGRGGGK